MLNPLNFEQKFSIKHDDYITINDCNIKGYASVFNVIDKHNDLIINGAFSESISYHSASNKVKLLWQHNHDEPIGIIKQIYEDNYGLMIEATINKTTQRGKEIISLLNQKAINGLSIGFKVTDFEYDVNGVRIIKKVDLWEVSIVTFPANEQAQIATMKHEYLPRLGQNNFSPDALTKAFTSISKLNQIF